MKPVIKQYKECNTNKVYNEMTAWFVVKNQYGCIEYSQLFCSLDEAYSWAKQDAKKIADNMELVLIDEQTVHVPFNVVLRYKVDGELARTVDPDKKGLEYTCIARKLKYDA